MLIVAKLRDDPEMPKPLYFGRHRRWRVSDIEHYEELLAKRPKPKKRSYAA